MVHVQNTHAIHEAARAQGPAGNYMVVTRLWAGCLCFLVGCSSWPAVQLLAPSRAVRARNPHGRVRVCARTEGARGARCGVWAWGVGRPDLRGAAATPTLLL